jgi:rubrerythrin
MRIPRIAVLIAVSAGMLTVVATTPAHADAERTRAALRMAYQREIDAQRQYAEFAEVADREGYPGVCDLFDALVRAEQVHAALHAFRLEQMDEQPVAGPSQFVVGTTSENLVASYENEMLERRTVYACFADAARDESQYDALAGFGYASCAEATHARALATAWFGLAELTSDHTYYVCTGCGRVRSDYSAAGCDCGAMTPKPLATRDHHARSREPAPVGPVAAR